MLTLTWLQRRKKKRKEEKNTLSNKEGGPLFLRALRGPLSYFCNQQFAPDLLRVPPLPPGDYTFLLN